MANAGPRCLRAPGMAVGVRLTLPVDAVPRSALSRQVDGSEGCGRLHGTDVTVLHVEAAPDVRRRRPGRSSRCLVAPVPSGRVCGQHQKCTARTRSHAASGWMRRVSMPAVALSNLGQCAKTHEVRHTPPPVRVAKVLPGPTWRPQHGGGRRGRARYRCGPCSTASELSRTLSTLVRDRDGGRQRPGARALLSYRRRAKEKG